MRNTLIMLLVAFMSTGSLIAQSEVREKHRSDVKNFFCARLDSLVALYNEPSTDDEDMTDIAFYRLFAPTLLYESTIERGLSQGITLPERKSASGIELNDARNAIIDEILLDVYKNYPLLVTATEEDVRSVISSKDLSSTQP